VSKALDYGITEPDDPVLGMVRRMADEGDAEAQRVLPQTKRHINVEDADYNCQHPWCLRFWPMVRAAEARARLALIESGEPASEAGVRLSENAHRHLKDLRRLAARAQNSYVGRNWPDMESMHRDGIGFGLNDREKEAAIRRYLYEFQPEFMLQVLDTVLAASLPALAPHPDPASAMQQATFNGGLPAPAHRGRVMAMNEEREVIDGIDVTGWARCGSPGCGVIEQVPSEHPHALPADPSGADR
jgi:hypothetical protein